MKHNRGDQPTHATLLRVTAEPHRLDRTAIGSELMGDIYSLLAGPPVPEPGARTLLYFLAGAVLFPLNRIADGLVDAELHWSPVPDAVTIGWTPTGHNPLTDPFSTIGWRWEHFCEELHGIATFDVCLGPEQPPWSEPVPPVADAVSAVANLEIGIRRAARAIATATDTRLDEEVENEFGRHTRRHWATLFLVEAVHHGAEIGVLRDLYRRLNGT